MTRLFTAALVALCLSTPAMAGTWHSSATMNCETYDFGLFSFTVCEGDLAYDRYPG